MGLPSTYLREIIFSAIAVTCTTLFLRGDLFTSGGILLPVEGMKELCFAVESLDAITS